MSEPEHFWNTDELAHHLRVKRSWVHDNIGDIPRIRLGRRWLFRPSEIEEWLNQRRG